MFTTLLESRATRPRSARSTMASVMLHSAAIVTAVAMTLPGRADARPKPKKVKDVVYVATDHRPTQPPTPRPPSEPPVPSTPLPTIAMPAVTPTKLPPIDFGPTLPPEQILIGGPGALTGSPIGGGTPHVFAPGAVVDEGVVERIPRMVGNAPAPRYPNALRESGISGRVVIRFVVDTLGRAELNDVVILEASHTLLTDAVKNALGLYRFSPGEVGGRKVRTMVQVPFTFALTR